jgi:2,5-dihydroxypyridine 5,6-dioxygenase
MNSMYSQFEMVNLFKEALELCALKPSETMIVLTEGDIRADYADALLLAGRDLGAFVFEINVPQRIVRETKHLVGRTGIAGNRPVIEALKQADIVIDLMGMLFSAEQNEITATGTRMLMVREPFDILRKMFPDKNLRRRVEFGEKLLEKADVLHITSAAGTDVTYRMGGYRVMTQYGYTDTPGRWDHLATGQVLSQAHDGMVNGKVVIAPGDLVTVFRRYIEMPVTLTIKDGYVVDVAGQGMDAQLIAGYLESFNDPRAYAISHIGWGLCENAKWFHNAVSRTRDAEIGVNSLSFYGNVLFSLGPNTELGGTNDTACHLDIPLRNANLYLDGETIVENGRIVPAEMCV